MKYRESCVCNTEVASYEYQAQPARLSVNPVVKKLFALLQPKPRSPVWVYDFPRFFSAAGHPEDTQPVLPAQPRDTRAAKGSSRLGRRVFSSELKIYHVISASKCPKNDKTLLYRLFSSTLTVH